MKSILLPLAALFSAFFLNSQTWSVPGAKWQYYVRGSFPTAGPFGINQVSFTNTVTLSGKTWARMTGTTQGTFGGMPWTGPSSEFLIRQENGIVFFSNGGNADTLANLNAIPGEGWYAEWDTDTTISKRTVVDTGRVTIGTQNRRALFFHANHQLAFIDGIGYNFGFFIPYKWFQPNSTDLYPHNGGFKCYSENGIAKYKPDTDWACATDVGVAEQVTDEFRWGPNPSGGKLYVESQQKWKITVFNLTGELVKTIAIDAGAQFIDLRPINEGIYLMILTTANDKKTARLLIQ